jgi:hypothetical protein
MNNFEAFFIAFLLPMLIAMAIDYAILKKVEEEKSNDYTETEKL